MKIWKSESTKTKVKSTSNSEHKLNQNVNTLGNKDDATPDTKAVDPPHRWKEEERPKQELDGFFR